MESLVNKLSLPDSYISSLIALRKELHQNAELAGKEEKTRQIILGFISSFAPHKIISPIGGQGLACIYQAKSDGPTLLFRAELDALPIREKSNINYKSLNAHVSHMCGHDGQMAILAGLSGLLRHCPLSRGRIILLFQPAEETGQGASAIISDPKFKQLTPDFVFALHNMPEKEKGTVYIKSGVFNWASSGMIIKLIGKSSHASRPEDGINPTIPMCEIIQGLSRLQPGSDLNDNFSMATIVYARLGEDSFGTAPGEAEIRATLRCQNGRAMELLENKATKLVVEQAQRQDLKYKITWCDRFAVSVNNEKVTEIISAAARTIGRKVLDLQKPLRWSEDFGQFTARFPGAMFLLGAGQTCPPLHSPEYDFPDDLIEIGLDIYWEIINHVLKR